MMMHTRAVSVIALCLAALPARAVNVSGGEIAGTHAGGLNTYLGIPYAAPPVGPLRWRAPQPVLPWQGIRQASSYAPACAQKAVWIGDPKSEDCLYLNLWAPEKADKLPVIVWIHGGGYYGGSASQPGFNGANLAKHGAIVVTVNYRLGIFGFFAHPELSTESPDHASGNQGILDQIEALRWVKRNIAAFGGDPERVTIVGESAGGESVALLVASPLAKGLFQRAIAESGNDALPLTPDEVGRFDRKAAEANGAAFAASVGAPRLSALRALSVEALQKPDWLPRTIVDGHVLREDLDTIYRNHRQNDVPLMVGWNAEEGKDLAAEILGTSEFTVAKHRQLVGQLLGHAPSDALLAAYPGASDAQAKASIFQLTNDWWGWRMSHWAGLQARYGRAKPYAYFFAHRPAEPKTPCGYGCGAGHGAEIQYVFENLDDRDWTRKDRELASQLAATWVAFARTGSPNGSGLPAWPVFDGTAASVFHIGDERLKISRLPDFSLPAAQIKLNQLGYLPASAKVAVVPSADARQFAVVSADGKQAVYAGALGAAQWSADAGETVRLADFSAFKTPGRYVLRVDGLADSLPFDISASAYEALNAASIRAYYLNRAGIALDTKHAGAYARAAGHPDTQVLVHPSAASAARPAGTVISSPKGWYDAGDYNKYVVNSGISSYTLLAAYEDFPDFFRKQNLNIPESGNGRPDLLNETLWNLEWMLTMQDPNDGGVYHKLTNLSFDGMVMPAEAKQPRYVVQKTTAAALDFAAVMATASRVYAPFDQALSQRMLAAAKSAWQWAQAHPRDYYQQPKDVSTGDYSDKDVSDEFAWAAAELYISTGDDAYYKAMRAPEVQATVPNWGDVRSLAWLSLARHRQQLSAAADQQLIADRVVTLSQRLADNWKKSAYGIAMQTGDYVWGSSAVALNQSMVLLHGYRLTGKRDYLDAAQSGLDYVLGRNAVDTSFVTGQGARAALHPHHRPSVADGIEAPVPGFLVGGPQPGQQDKKDCGKPYPSALPAKAWLDHACSYASNEIAINWNAPLVYVSAALQAIK